ncbi:MAG: hypothetical protein QX191_00100 [Methylococcaceae bacterium]
MEFIMPLQVSAKPWGALRLGFSLATLNQEIVNSRKNNWGQSKLKSKFTLTPVITLSLVGAASCSMGNDLMTLFA